MPALVSRELARAFVSLTEHVLLERTVLVDGKHLEVAVHEPSSAPRTTIVMLHEGLGCVALWRDFPARLAELTRDRVVVYSRYGYGRSDVLDMPRDVDYLHHEANVVLPQLLERLNIRRPVLFGHSDGASIALICAGTRPDLPAGLVLEAPHVFVEDRTIAGISAARTAYLETDLAEKLDRYHRDVGRTFWGWNDIWLDPRFRSWNIERYLSAVRCPVLVMQGDDDEYATPAQPQAIKAAIEQAQIAQIAQCGHTPHRDRMHVVLDATAVFLRESTAGSTAACGAGSPDDTLRNDRPS